MNYKREHKTIVDHINKLMMAKNELVRNWIKAEGPHQPGSVITVPEESNLYVGLKGIITMATIGMGGPGPEYYWQYRGAIIDQDGKPTAREFRFRIKMKN